MFESPISKKALIADPMKTISAMKGRPLSDADITTINSVLDNAPEDFNFKALHLACLYQAVIITGADHPEAYKSCNLGKDFSSKKPDITDARHSSIYVGLALKAFPESDGPVGKIAGSLFATIPKEINKITKEHREIEQIAKEMIILLTKGRSRWEQQAAKEEIATIREINPEDILSLMEIIERVLDNLDINDSEKRQTEIEQIASYMSGVREKESEDRIRNYFIAQNDNNEIIGCMAYSKPDKSMRDHFSITDSNAYEILNAFIDPEHHKKGAGKALFQRITEQAYADGIDTIVVNSGPRYEDSWPFYDSVCEKDYGFIRNKYGDGRDAKTWKYTITNKNTPTNPELSFQDLPDFKPLLSNGQFLVPIDFPEFITDRRDGGFRLSETGDIEYLPIVQEGTSNTVHVFKREHLDALVIAAHQNEGKFTLEEDLQEIEPFFAIISESLKEYVEYFLQRDLIILSLELGEIYTAIMKRASEVNDEYEKREENAINGNIDQDSKNETNSIIFTEKQIEYIRTNDITKLIKALNHRKQSFMLEGKFSELGFITDMVTFLRESSNIKSS